MTWQEHIRLRLAVQRTSDQCTLQNTHKCDHAKRITFQNYANEILINRLSGIPGSF